MSSTLPKLALRRETVRNLGVKSSVRAGSLVGSFSDGGVAAQNTTNPVPKSSGTVGPHSSDTGGGGGTGGGGTIGWVIPF